MFMTANIKPLVDGAIRGALLNKLWFFNLAQSMCVTGSVKTEEVRGNIKPVIKEATGGHQDWFGKSSMLV